MSSVEIRRIDGVADTKAEPVMDPSWLKNLKERAENNTYSEELADQFNRVTNLLTKKAVPHVRLRMISDFELLLDHSGHFMAEFEGEIHRDPFHEIPFRSGPLRGNCQVNLLFLREERPQPILATLGDSTEGIRIDLVQSENLHGVSYRKVTILSHNVGGGCIGPDLRTEKSGCDGLWEETVLAYAYFMRHLFKSYWQVGSFIRESSGLAREIGRFLHPKDLESLLLAITFGIPVDDETVKGIVKKFCFSLEQEEER